MKRRSPILLCLTAAALLLSLFTAPACDFSRETPSEEWSRIYALYSSEPAESRAAQTDGAAPGRVSDAYGSDAPTAAPEPTAAEANETLISPPLPKNAAAPANAAQDIAFFAQGVLTFNELHEIPGSHMLSRGLKDGNAGKIFDVFEAYVAMLEQNGFVRVGYKDKEFPSQNKRFFSASLNAADGSLQYTLDGDSLAMDHQGGNITVSGSIDRSRCQMQFFVTDELNVTDLGFRYGGGSVDTSYTGASACAGVYKKGETFRTDDGRLQTKTGEAAVIADGQTFTVKTKTTRQDQILCFYVPDYDRSDGIGLRCRESQLKQGDLFTQNELFASKSVLELMRDSDTVEQLDYLIADPILAFRQQDRNEVPVENGLSSVRTCFVRTVYYAPGQRAVFYVAAAFDAAPYSVEALAAFDLTAAGTGGQQNGGSGGNTGGNAGGQVGSPCGRCNASGEISCDECGSTGYINRVGPNGAETRETCPTCHGRTRVECPVCHGEKYLTAGVY